MLRVTGPSAQIAARRHDHQRWMTVGNIRTNGVPTLAVWCRHISCAALVLRFTLAL
jgi:hypothetical protein